MPELPEVETIRAQLEPRLVGRLLVRVEILDPRLTRPIDLFEVAEELEGDSIVAVERRGKYLVLRLESGLSLLVHLRMTGSFGFEPTSHERAVLELDDGTRLGYRDVRRFGTWLVLEDTELEPYLAGKNGPEPLGPRFTAEWLAARLAGRRAPVKAVLLDQRVAAGIGNIYADEALWRARVNPLRPAASLDPDEVRRMHRAVRAALRAGIERPGINTLRVPHSGRIARRNAGRVSGVWTRRPAVPSLRHDDREDAGRRPRHLVLPALPAIGLAAGRTG